ncbi:hypothetical protein DICVIV_00174 [Dictyocaulus viviparus]|uniref:Uncharacterized protein n=1 Tax=Dictyocaulus viviparus TaxID=29172 RepID=A0A0D8YAI3_DICVI|nr:hypothetical protein DICVIV_00174 [Dictyocaulus viviparus]
MRATRMSVVDFWKNETLGDGFNIRVAHGVNSWPDLVDQLHEPFLNKSMLIEGDVFLHTARRPRNRAIPVMRANARTADRITFKEWLREVSNLQKVLQYLYASQVDPLAPILQYPIILHANVFRSPRSIENTIDASTFVDQVRLLFPDATVSLGWTRQSNFTKVNPKYKRLTWKKLFQILEYIIRLEQPVMLSVRLSVASNSKDQLLWLLGIDKAVSLLIWSDQEDVNLFIISDRGQQIQKDDGFSLTSWRAVEFATSQDILSTVIRSNKGVVFIGHPAALLISQIPPPLYPSYQRIDGKVQFLSKAIRHKIDVDDHTGLVIYLMDRMLEIESPEIKDTLKVFIGHDGRVFIKNKESALPYYESKSVAQLPYTECYGFSVIDRGWRVIADIWTIQCEKKYGNRQKRSTKIRLELDTPFFE